MLNIPDLASPHSRTSSGRSTPRNVVFGPLPESYGGSKGEGPSNFQKQKEAKARAKGKGKGKDFGKGKEKDGESSWWTTWLTGGSGLSMSAARHEERAEDRMARSWGRPGMNGNFEDWPI